MKKEGELVLQTPYIRIFIKNEWKNDHIYDRI